MAAHTFCPTHTNGRVATAARVVGHITDSAGVIDALTAVTIKILDTRHTLRATQAQRCVDRTPSIVRLIAELTLLTDTLTAIALCIASTLNTGCAIGQTDRSIRRTPCPIGWVAGLAGLAHTLLTIAAIAIAKTTNATQDAVVVCTNGPVYRTATAIGWVTDKTIAADTLGGIATAIVVYLAADTAVAVVTLHTIRCIGTAPLVSSDLTLTALPVRTNGCIGIRTVPIAFALTAIGAVITGDTQWVWLSTTDVGKALTDTTGPIGTNGLVRICTIGILPTLCTCATHRPIDTEWCIPITAHIALPLTSHTLAVLTLACIRVVAIAVVATANAGDTKGLDGTEGCELKTAFV